MIFQSFMDRHFDMQHLSFFRSLPTIFCLGLIASLHAMSASEVRADEPVVEFLDGLRARKYFDTAIEYIDLQQQRADLPAETRAILSLQRGLTFEAEARASRVVEDRDLSLGKAEAAFRKFLKDNPEHPQAAFVNSSLGSLLFERARSLVWDAEAPSNLDKRPEMQKQARALIDQAEKIFQTSHDQYEAQYKAFPPRIDQDQEPEQFLAWRKAEVAYLRAWYNLVRATYQRGQTFDLNSKQRNDTLLQAFKKFEEIHTARRSNPIGLQARLMMGKCFQEQGDVNRALGIYNEIIDGDSTQTFSLMMKSNAIQFRLICLNDEKKKDFQLVLQEADRWLTDKQYRQFWDREVGLGIRWEKILAMEKLSGDRTLEESERTSLVRAALSEAKKVALYSSPYRAVATSMSQKLQAALGDADADPTDFATAFERAKGLVTQLTDFDEKIEAAKSNSDRRSAQQAKQRQWDEIARLLKMALDLREPGPSDRGAAQARYLLGHALLSQRKSYDAFIVARYCMTKDRLVDPDSARDSCAVAIQAAVQAFNDAGDDQSFEMQMLKDVCESIIELYPNGSRGNEARYRLAKIYRDLNKPAEAAASYLTIPAEAPLYASARIQAAQSLWLASGQFQAENFGTERTAEQTKQLDAWKADAIKYFLEGLKVARQAIGPNASPTAEMVAAEVTLASIANLDGKFQQTIKRLTDGGPNSVVAATEVGNGKQRPETGVQSGPFVGQLWRQLLRAYVGTQQIDKALDAMSRLEAVGGQDTAVIYTELGRELEQEIERLKEAGETERLKQVRSSFEQFLSKVYDQRDKTDYNSLLWIGETYFSLGKGVGAEDQAAADAYLIKASQAYTEILDSNLAPETSIFAVKLRVARCQRRLRNFQAALDLSKQILSQQVMQLDVQFEAAHTLSDWGADSDVERLKQSIEGIVGPDEKPLIWGWQRLATRLNNRQGTDEWESLKPRFLDASYESLRSRLLLAESGIPNKAELLSGAKAQAEMFAVVNFEPQPEPGGKLPDDEPDFQRFSRLHEKIQVALGQAPQPLERDTRVKIPDAVASAAKTNTDNPKNPNGVPEPAGAPSKPEPANYILITLAVGLAAGGGFAFYNLMGKQSKKRPAYTKTDAPVMPLAGAGPDFGDLGRNDDVPDFSGLASVAPPSTKIGLPRKKSASGQRRSEAKPTSPVKADAPSKAARPAAKKVATGAAGSPSDKPGEPVAAPAKKKRRVLTPEEMVRYKAAKLAKAKAAAQQAAADGTSPAEGKPAVRKVVKKRPSGSEGGAAGQPQSGQAAPRKKLVKKRPPQPPTTET